MTAWKGGNRKSTVFTHFWYWKSSCLSAWRHTLRHTPPTLCLYIRLTALGVIGEFWVQFFLNKGLRRFSKGTSRGPQWSCFLGLHFYLLLPLFWGSSQSMPGAQWAKFDILTGQESWQVMVPVTSSVSNPQISQKALGVSVLERRGTLQKGLLKICAGFSNGERAWEGPSQSDTNEMVWSGMGKSFSLPLSLIRSTHCRGQASLTGLCWKVTQHWGSVMSYSSEECLAFYGYFNWWQYSLLKVLTLALRFSHVLLHPEHSSCLRAAFSSLSEAAAPPLSLLRHYLVWSV